MKFIVYFLMTLFVVSVASATEITLVDSKATTTGGYENHGTSTKYQSFNMTVAATFQKLSIYVTKGGGTSDTGEFWIDNTNSCLNNLSKKVSVSTSDIPYNYGEPNLGWYNISFPDVVLNGSEDYAICISGESSNDWLRWAKDLTNPYVNGSFDGQAFDKWFKLYGTRDTGIPVILSANCTSCNIPVGDTTPPYETADTTPTFSITTDLNANCRIEDVNSNYTTMGGSTNQTCSGSGTKAHTCTLASVDELIDSTDDVFISCASLGNGETSNATKVLHMNITGLVENRSKAIETGIKNSVIWPGATIYSNQQVYLRSVNNSQRLVTVDKVAVFGNKRWLFDYGDTLNLFNITPVVYVLEMDDMSLGTIQTTVKDYIDATQ